MPVTKMQVIHEISDGETTNDDSRGEQEVLMPAHFMVEFVVFLIVFQLISNRLLDKSLPVREHLVEAVSTWQDLERVREEDKDDDGKLSDRNKKRR